MGQGPNMDRQLRRGSALRLWGPAEGFQLGGGRQFHWGWVPHIPSGGFLEMGLRATLKILVTLLTAGQALFSCDFCLL